MNWLERSIETLFPQWAVKRAQARYVARQYYDAASLDRLRVRSTYQNVGPVAENRSARPTLLNTARDLDRNNSFAHGAFNSITNNVVGRGIRLESRISTRTGKLLETPNRDVEENWKRWAESVDLAGKMSFYELQALCERELWVAGEILVVKDVVTGRKPIPLVLEAVESERLAALDTEIGANKVVQGVEYSPLGSIVAYHIYNEHPSDGLARTDPERIPSERVIHLFHSTRPNQVRGLSRVAPVARNFEALNQFMDHELTKARVASSFAVMIKRGGSGMAPRFPSADSTATTDANGDVVDSNDNPLGHLEGGMIFYGGPNDDLSGTGPSIQAGDFEQFVCTNLRAIATGLNMSYELLARDFTRTNFSSARQSGLEDKRHWEPRQQYLITHLNNPIFRWFSDMALTSGVPVFVKNAKRIQTDWITPPREYVDPQKEVQADILAVAAGFTNIQKVTSKHGTDAHENVRLNAQLLEEAEEAGLKLKAFEGSGASEEEQTDDESTRKPESTKAVTA